MMRTLGALDVKRLVVAALFVPVLLFSFFSVHTMPRFSADGMEIVICTGNGVETVSVGGDDDRDDKPAHAPCEWSAQIHAAMLSAAGLAAEPLALGHFENFAFEKTLLRSQRRNAGNDARAPPLFV
ncbi:hypothetical protein [Hoeflea ulvae]|uniref:DUF2946 domain-containing protein n=1 Tax=Hoeflea ulvae TaxID=2983764 RepID=A0ABT3YEN6_9HYPH|nr:hypothetical protein [Hoeflea ulvae]MCY0094339.1 hypothetical protein [Hoeflea ulvae]